ncbi:MAG: 16S rRNA (adenine(1518)-N(6)/adenine(1519)-N(6))-dimethyltransferase RsmA [Gemmatimonadota bacterium]|nr:16S rRNA (adenine(1518)-N(6)/adenine(1519)-N(6))-dimethyltransferase RsmA [Gemmatimonadota bacterium]
MARAPHEGASEGGRRRSTRQPPVLKKYGQHFLSDERILEGIVNALAPTPADTVVEVGPGRGSLTDILAERSGRLIAVEIDRALAEQLREKYRDRPNVEIVQGDVLETDLHALAGADFLLIGNVPYYITTPIVFKALDPPIPRRSVFLVQREVADRMTAKEDTESYGALSVNVAVVANTQQVMSVPASSFKPPPKVESAVIRLTPRIAPLVSGESLPGFRTFVQAMFGQRRKQIQRALRTVRGMSAIEAGEVLERAEIEISARPEVVSPEGFVRLFELL